jgi:hypothetical protein
MNWLVVISTFGYVGGIASLIFGLGAAFGATFSLDDAPAWWRASAGLILLGVLLVSLAVGAS